MKKGQILKNIKVTAIGFGGVGIGVAENGKKILIKGSILPHSVIDCVIIKAKRDHILGMPTRVISIEDGRATETPRCPHYSNPLVPVADNYIHKNGCGGCKRQLLSYEKQLELKVHLVHDSFRATQYLLEQAGLEPIIPSPLTYQYRNKIEFSFGKYITKAKNDKKAQDQRNGEQNSEQLKTKSEEGTIIARNEAIHDKNPSSENSDFSHRFDRQLGFHKQGFYTHVVDVDQCYLISDKLHQVYNHIKTLCKDSGLAVYDSKQNAGFFRHLVLREGVNTGQILVNLVIATDELNTEDKEAMWEDYRNKILSDNILRTECDTFLITTNNTVSDAIRRQEAPVEILWGQGHIFEELHFTVQANHNEEVLSDNMFFVEDGILKELKAERGMLKGERGNIQKSPSTNQQLITKNQQLTTNIRFRVSPFSFFQTNTLGAQELFSKAASFIKLPHSKQTIMDLYCGAGTIGLSLLAQGIGNFVIGIEIVEDAVKDANYNAQINKLDTKSYFAAGKTEVLLKHDNNIASKLDNVGLVIVDPPREGLHKDVVEFLNTFKKDHKFQLIYISCNPVTLARDLDLFVQSGLRTLQTLQPVDMFPHTHHIEMISVLE